MDSDSVRSLLGQEMATVLRNTADASLPTASAIMVHEAQIRAWQDTDATMHALLNAPAADSTLVLDRNGIVLAVNAIAAKRIGMSCDELVGRCLYDLFEPDLASSRRQYIEQVFLTGEPARFEDRRKGFEFDNHVAPVLDESGQVTRVVIFARDITEVRRAEEAARLKQEQLIQADKMVALGRLVSGVAHEINNPNQFIMGNVALLARAWQGALPVLEEYYEERGDFSMGGLRYTVFREKLPQLLQGIQAGADRIKAIVRELGDYARREPFAIDAAVDVGAVARSAVALVAKVVEESTDHFELRCGENVPMVPGNFQRLEQVCVNLIVNACQALPGRDAAVRVETDVSPDGSEVLLSVIDEGVGIPQEHLKQITDPFFTTRRDQGGTGLGLSVSAAIVQEHGGVLQFQSAPAKGTHALLRLPVCGKTPPAAPDHCPI